MEKEQIAVVLQGVKLPSGVKWYNVANRMVFEVRGQDGSVEARSIAYLVHSTKEKELEKRRHYRYAIEFTPKMGLTKVRQKAKTAVRTFMSQLAKEKAKPFDPDGGSLGRERDNPERQPKPGEEFRPDLIKS